MPLLYRKPFELYTTCGAPRLSPTPAVDWWATLHAWTQHGPEGYPKVSPRGGEPKPHDGKESDVILQFSWLRVPVCMIS